MPDDDFFELFVAEQVLWEHDLSWDELLAGVVGGGRDGGIDGVFVFLNGMLLSPESEKNLVRGAVHFDLHIIQAKRSPSFDETVIDKLRTSLSDLLDFGRPLEELEGYNDGILGMFGRFRQQYVATASRFPSVTIKIWYGSKGGADIDPNVRRRASELEDLICGLFSASTCKFNFVTPSDFVESARRQKPTSLNLDVEDVIVTSGGGSVALVSLRDYFRFVSDEHGNMRTSLLESNVRDYEGNSGVNASIQGTLTVGTGEDFWWLNNGVTVVASRSALTGKTLVLGYPQIVNGLQTTREIFEYISRDGPRIAGTETRSLLVRVIVPADDVSRDRIIRATNSQTPIPSVALRATDKIQRDLEEYLLQHNLYYERRKNKYQNEGKPISRIVTIPYMAESFLAVARRKPHTSAPRWGGRFLRDDKTYAEIFGSDIPLDVYLKSVLLTRRVENRIKERTNDWPRQNRLAGLRTLLPVATALSVVHAPKGRVSSLDIDSVADDEIDGWSDIAIELSLSKDPTAKSRRSERTVVNGIFDRLAELGLVRARQVQAPTFKRDSRKAPEVSEETGIDVLDVGTGAGRRPKRRVRRQVLTTTQRAEETSDVSQYEDTTQSNAPGATENEESGQQ